MQHRHKTELTAAEYVKQKAWRSATPPRCLKRCDSLRCGIQRHGTYSRKTPCGMRIQRWCCRRCQTTFSALPDCLASHYRGTVDDLERLAAQIEAAPSIMAAVVKMHPGCDNPEMIWRRFRRCLDRVHRTLSVLCGLLDPLHGAQPTVLGVRMHLGSQQVLMRLRNDADAHLGNLLCPVGFRRAQRGYGSQTGPPH